MLHTPLCAARAKEHEHRELHACGVCLASSLYVVHVVAALGDSLQGGVITRFGPDIKERKPQFFQAAQIFGALLQNVGCHGIAGDLSERRKDLSGTRKNGFPVRKIHDQRIAVGYEQFFDLATEAGASVVQMFQAFL